jgi:hypothetical protein
VFVQRFEGAGETQLMELVMRGDNIQRTLPIFGVLFDNASEQWCAFLEDSHVILSEHTTEAQAHAACRSYEFAACRRFERRPLEHLSRVAI